MTDTHSPKGTELGGQNSSSSFSMDPGLYVGMNSGDTSCFGHTLNFPPSGENVYHGQTLQINFGRTVAAP